MRISPWLSAEELLGADAPSQFADASDAFMASLVAGTTLFLFRATAERFPGVSPFVERPYPWQVDGYIYRPRMRPVVAVSEIKVDGVVLDAAEYQLEPDSKVRRLAVGVAGAWSRSMWPTSQNLGLPVSEVGTWQVTYTAGVERPEDGHTAAIELATEVGKYLLGCADCALPKNMQSIEREGVQVTFPSPAEVLDNGMTGLQLVDRFLASQGGITGRTRPRPRVHDPEAKRY